MEIDKIFKIPLSNNVMNLTDQKFLIACTSDEHQHPDFILSECRSDLFAQSQYCRRSAKLCKIDDIAHHNYNNIDLSEYTFGDTNSIHIMIVFIPADIALINPVAIYTLEELAEWLTFADQYQIDIAKAFESREYKLWLHILQAEQRFLWENNKIMVQPIESKDQLKPKFTAITTLASNYPNSRPIPKYPSILVTENGFGSDPSRSKNDLIYEVYVILARTCPQIAEILANLLLFSIEYCGLIAHAPFIKIAGIGKIINEYSIYYAMRVLYLEEVSVYKKRLYFPRVILSGDQVSTLTKLDITIPALNPYLPLAYYPGSNVPDLTLPYFLQGDRGIYSLARFRERFAEYSQGVFKYLDWGDPNNPNTVLCGSAMTACAIINPLERSFQNLNNYFEEYYPSADCVHKQKSETIKINQKSNNAEIAKIYMEDNSDDEDNKTNVSIFEDTSIRRIRDVETTHMVIGRGSRRMQNIRSATANTNQIIIEQGKSEIDANNNSAAEYTDIDIMIATETLQEFDEIVARHFTSIQKGAQDAINTIQNGAKLELVRIETENKHKWRIRGLRREIELFHVGGGIDGITHTISKFHLGCVRAWYDGKDIRCYPSFVCAALTGLNPDMRWTSCNKDLRDIVLKYFQRGFGTIANTDDRRSILQYVGSPANSQQTHYNWPQHPDPPSAQTNGRSWRQHRQMIEYNRTPMYANVKSIFMPSASKCGVHAHTGSALYSQYPNIIIPKFKPTRKTYKTKTPIEQLYRYC